MPMSINYTKLRELEFRFQRIQKQLIITELEYELAISRREPPSLIEDLKSDLENLKRKLNWFAGALKRYLHQEGSVE